MVTSRNENTMTIYDTGRYTVSKLADKHYVVYYEDESTVEQIATYTNELSAIKRAEKLSNS